MPVTIQLQCPACGKYLAFPAERAGTISICNACGGPIVVPEIPPEQLAPPEPIFHPPRYDEPPPQPRSPYPAPPTGLLGAESVPSSEDESVVELVPVEEEPQIVKRAGPPAKLSQASMDALNRMAEVAAKAPPEMPPAEIPVAPEPIDLPRLPENLPSEIPESLPAPVIPELKGETDWVVWIASIGAGVVILGAVLVIWVVFIRRPSWEAQNRDQIVALIDSAEESFAHEDPATAWDKYRKLEHLVAGQTISDPELSQKVDRAKKRESQMFDLMVAAANRPPVPASAPSTQTVVVLPPTRESILPGQPEPPPPVTQAATLPALPILPGPQNPQGAPRRPLVRAMAAPPPPQGPSGGNIPDDEQIGRSIRLGVNGILGEFNSDGRIKEEAATDAPEEAIDALAVYALLQASQTIEDDRLKLRGPFMSKALDALKRMPMNNGVATYGRGLRALALSLAGRPEDTQALSDELRWFRHAGSTGAFRYVNRISAVGAGGAPDPSEVDWWDNSNSQYGLLGVWAVAEAGIDVPDEFWYVLQRHWLSTQLPNGQWAYRAGDNEGTLSMTLAGIASLFVTHDYLSIHDREAGPLPTQLLLGLEWLETGDHCVITDPGMRPLYATYGLERVGLASGFKYFGSHDWYPEMASAVLQNQGPGGDWGGADSDDLIQTCFAVLFLSRGRHPVMASKLRYDGRWDNHPRDLANLAHFASTALERPLNWQVVPSTRPSASGQADNADDAWTDWSDSPMLFISSDEQPQLDEGTAAKLRAYALHGGLIVTQTQEGGAAFQTWSDDLGKRLFPGREWHDLPAGHPLYSVALAVANHPKISAIDNGARLLMVNFPQDVSVAWKTRVSPREQSAMALGVNLFVYASGKSEFRNRLVTHYIPPVADSQPPQASIHMALFITGAEPDPEPAAWPRFANWFRRQTDLQVKLEGPSPLVDMGKLTPADVPLAHLTGTAAWQPTADQIAGVKQYVEAGGVLLIDPCGGPNGFDQTVREQLLPKAFPGGELDGIEASHPLLNKSGDGMEDISTAQVRLYSHEITLANGRQPQILRAGKGFVIVSPLDLTCGVLGLHQWGIAGFEPDYCLNLARNVVLWTWDGKSDPQ